jgi:hypothetical protein
MNTQDEETRKRQLTERFQERFWEGIDTVSNGWSSTGHYSAGEAAAYAHGYRDALFSLAERFEVDPGDYDQFAAALGERQRRAQVEAGAAPVPSGNDMDSPAHLRVAARRRLVGGVEFKNLTLRRIATAIRDKRIAMVDRYEGLGLKEDEPWLAKLRRFGLHGCTKDGEAAEYDAVRAELRMLRHLYLHLISDREWFRRHCEAKATAENAVTAKEGVAA